MEVTYISFVVRDCLVYLCVCVLLLCVCWGGGVVMRHSLECLPRYDFLSDDAQMSVVQND